MAVNSSKDPWLEALCAGAVNSQVLLKKIYCFCIVKKASWSLMKGKGREPLILNSFCQCWAFQHYFSFYQYFLFELKRPTDHWSIRQAADYIYWLKNDIKGPPANVCLPLQNTGILVLFLEVKYLLPPCSAYFWFRKLMLTWTMFSPICCHYQINEKWQNYTSGSFES